ncbi:MAG: glycosyltransferase family 39 protein [Anaerolineae bacterium]|nr:glycosyltransferase family 39 protein [Anaerolineae bacterium]
MSHNPISHRPSPQTRAFAGALILLAAALILISRAGDLSMWFSEVFTFFHTGGTFEQVLDPDLAFPPGYYVAMYGWRHLVGWHDFAASMFGVLSGMFTVAFVLRIGRETHSWWTGWLAAFAFATSSYATYFMLENRASGLQMTTMALAAWMHLRWLKRPAWNRAVMYGLSCTLMLFVHYFGAFVIAFFALHLALTNWRLWWRWLLIVTFAVLLLLPLIPPAGDIVNLFLGIRSGDHQFTGYFVAPLSTFYQALSARWDALFGVIVLGAAGGLVWLWRRDSRAKRAAVVWLAVWGVATPLAAYVTREQLGLFVTRYLSFTLIGIYALLGLGLAALPRRLRLLLAGLLVALMFAPWQPFDHRPNYNDTYPTRDVIVYLGAHMQPDDVLLLASDLHTLPYALDWWYYESIYAPPGGVPRLASGDLSARRIWYLEDRRKPDAALKDLMRQDHIAITSHDAGNLQITLYESPPDSDPGIRVGEHIVFRGVDVIPNPYRAPYWYHVAEEMEVRLWWSVDAPPELDYSMSLRIVDKSTGEIIAQSDGPPAGALTPHATSAWEPGRIYRDDRSMKFPFDMHMGNYDLQLVVYWWGDGAPLRFTLEDGTTTDVLSLTPISVLSFNTG